MKGPPRHTVGYLGHDPLVYRELTPLENLTLFGRLYRLPGLPTTDAAATAAGLAFRSGLLVVPERLRHGPALKEARVRVGR